MIHTVSASVMKKQKSSRVVHNVHHVQRVRSPGQHGIMAVFCPFSLCFLSSRLSVHYRLDRLLFLVKCIGRRHPAPTRANPSPAAPTRADLSPVPRLPAPTRAYPRQPAPTRATRANPRQPAHLRPIPRFTLSCARKLAALQDKAGRIEPRKYRKFDLENAPPRRGRGKKSIKADSGRRKGGGTANCAAQGGWTQDGTSLDAETFYIGVESHVLSGTSFRFLSLRPSPLGAIRPRRTGNVSPVTRSVPISGFPS